mmetsp:Transcript_8200/g.13598  ORF Transcript_8200/g.13598 Transcript_8200/m.13598 type:complete len:321 (+) Transcript_8200:850-1812(+)
MILSKASCGHRTAAVRKARYLMVNVAALAPPSFPTPERKDKEGSLRSFVPPDLANTTRRSSLPCSMTALSWLDSPTGMRDKSPLRFFFVPSRTNDLLFCPSPAFSLSIFGDSGVFGWYPSANDMTNAIRNATLEHSASETSRADPSMSNAEGSSSRVTRLSSLWPCRDDPTSSDQIPVRSPSPKSFRSITKLIVSSSSSTNEFDSGIFAFTFVGSESDEETIESPWTSQRRASLRHSAPAWTCEYCSDISLQALWTTAAMYRRWSKVKASSIVRQAEDAIKEASTRSSSTNLSGAASARFHKSSFRRAVRSSIIFLTDMY